MLESKSYKSYNYISPTTKQILRFIPKITKTNQKIFSPNSKTNNSL